MKAPEKYRTEVVPYAEAPWAPHMPGYEFRWAWRVLNPDGSVHATGVSNGSVENARAQADTVADRRLANNRGILIPRTSIIKKTSGRTAPPTGGPIAEDGLTPLLSDEG
jgi:hypothetical protein